MWVQGKSAEDADGEEAETAPLEAKPAQTEQVHSGECPFMLVI